MILLPTATEFCLRSLTIIIVVLQSVILDWYLVHYGGNGQAIGWVAADIVVVVVFILSFIYADLYFKQNQQQPRGTKKGEENAEGEAQPHITGSTERMESPKNGETDAKDVEKAIAEGKRRSQLNGNLHINSPNENEPLKPDSEFLEDFEADNEDPDQDYQSMSAVQKYNSVQKKRTILDDHLMSSLKVGPIRKKYHLGALPLAYLSWALYSSVLIAKMMVTFFSFGELLDSNLLLGSNMLELAFVSTAAVFALIVSSHKQIPRGQKLQKTVIAYMQGRVLMDIIDSVELLEFVYAPDVDKSQPKIEPAVKIAILVLVAIQVFLPTLGLYQLSATNFAYDQKDTVLSGFWTMLHQMLNLFLENIPFLVIRIYLWSNNQFTESTFVFITKNVFEIVFNDWDFIIWLKLWILGNRQTAARATKSRHSHHRRTTGTIKKV